MACGRQRKKIYANLKSSTWKSMLSSASEQKDAFADKNLQV